MMIRIASRINRQRIFAVMSQFNSGDSSGPFVEVLNKSAMIMSLD